MSDKLPRLRDFDKNKENPFVNQAIEQIQSNIVKKYRGSGTGSDRKAILRAVDDNGEIVGHTSFVRQIEVDEEKFTKLYLSNFSAFFDLNPSAIKVFGYIMTMLQPKRDMFTFFLDDCMEFTGYKSHKSIHEGLIQLLNAKIIARGRIESFYFINPMVAFNGDRVTFAKTYVKKQRPKELDPAQTNLLDQIKDFDNGL